jgi:hypothetical protein
VHRGFLSLLGILRRARISGINRARISGTDKGDFVADADTAVRVGEAAFAPIQGKKQIAAESPFDARVNETTGSEGKTARLLWEAR